MTHLITNHELTRLSLAELQGLYRIIFNELAQSQPGTPERRNALASLERILREIRRRTRVVGCFPDGQSALMLAAARLRHIAGTKWGLYHRPLSFSYRNHGEWRLMCWRRGQH